VNLDVLDGRRWPALPLPAPARWEPALHGRDAQGDFATVLSCADAPMVAIPSPPGDLPPRGDELGNAHFTLLLNACRLLQEKREAAPLYTLTDRQHDRVSLAEARLPLHPDEGDTSRPRRSWMPEEVFASPAAALADNPLFMWLLVAALAVHAVERTGFVVRGRAWR